MIQCWTLSFWFLGGRLKKHAHQGIWKELLGLDFLSISRRMWIMCWFFFFEGLSSKSGLISHVVHGGRCILIDWSITRMGRIWFWLMGRNFAFYWADEQKLCVCSAYEILKISFYRYCRDVFSVCVQLIKCLKSSFHR